MRHILPSWPKRYLIFSMYILAVILPNSFKDVLYSMFGPDLLGLTVAVQNIVG